MSTKDLKRGLLWGLVVFSLGSLVFAPLHTLQEKLVHALPWVGTGVILTEAMFIGGLCIMATSIGMKVHVRTVFSLRAELKEILSASTATPTFWVGFWMNAIGAVGSGLVTAAGIFMALPVTSWGLACIPFADLVVTIVIRQWALQAHARVRSLS